MRFVSVGISVGALTMALLAGPVMAAPPLVTSMPSASADLTALPMHIGGRVLKTADGYTYQWPGTYFEAAFEGRAVYFKVGQGEQILHVAVDDQPAAPLVKPAPGLYEIGNLPAGRHTVRVEVVTESQAGPDGFGG